MSRRDKAGRLTYVRQGSKTSDRSDVRLLSISFGREEENQDYEKALSNELTADFQTRYLHCCHQEHQEETT